MAQILGGSLTLHFYPRPPRGGRRGFQVALNLLQLISIHALREEGDVTWSAARLWAA